MNLGMTEILIILLIALLLFGPRKLPELGRSWDRASASSSGALKASARSLKKPPT